MRLLRRRADKTVATPRAVDIAGDVGLAVPTRTYGAVVFDYDNDGWPDVFISGHSAAARLYRNSHGHFSPVRSVTFPQADRHGCVAGDINGDGRMDLYCTIGGRDGKLPKKVSNELWIQQQDGTFVNDGEQPGLADPYGRGRQAALLDVTGDGRLDLFVANASPRQDGQTSENRLYLNMGVDGFRPAPEFGLNFELSCGSSGAGPPRGSLDAFDFDGDGWTDLLMCARNTGGNAAGQSTSLRLFRNENGKRFRDVTASVGLSGEAFDVAIADLDGDGRPDLVTVDRTGMSVHLYTEGRYETAFRMPVPHAFRVAVADADGDGHPDIYIMRRRSGAPTHVNDLLLVRKGDIDRYEVIEVPQPSGTGTVADDVVPLDHDRDGRHAFLVLNGAGSEPAPVQLISLR